MIEKLMQRYPQLKRCESEIARAIEMMLDTYRRGGKILCQGEAAKNIKILVRHRSYVRGIGDNEKGIALQADENTVFMESLDNLLEFLHAAGDRASATKIALQIMCVMVEGDLR